MKAWYDELDKKVNAIQAINTTDLDKKKSWLQDKYWRYLKKNTQPQ